MKKLLIGEISQCKTKSQLGKKKGSWQINDYEMLYV